VSIVFLPVARCRCSFRPLFLAGPVCFRQSVFVLANRWLEVGPLGATIKVAPNHHPLFPLLFYLLHLRSSPARVLRETPAYFCYTVTIVHLFCLVRPASSAECHCLTPATDLWCASQCFSLVHPARDSTLSLVLLGPSAAPAQRPQPTPALHCTACAACILTTSAAHQSSSLPLPVPHEHYHARIAASTPAQARRPLSGDSLLGAFFSLHFPFSRRNDCFLRPLAVQDSVLSQHRTITTTCPRPPPANCADTATYCRRPSSATFRSLAFSRQSNRFGLEKIVP
jgi:hypothetical protein